MAQHQWNRSMRLTWSTYLTELSLRMQTWENTYTKQRLVYAPFTAIILAELNATSSSHSQREMSTTLRTGARHTNGGAQWSLL